jgi:RND family efflux transporter MFP subunit
MPPSLPTSRSWLPSLLLPLLAACAPAPAAVQQALPPTPVTVATVTPEELAEHTEFTGRFAAVDDVELRARVSGYLDGVHFEAGQTVEKGQLLFTIDPRWNEAATAATAAAVAEAEVALSIASSEAERAAVLAEGRAISTEELEERNSVVARARAALASAQAAQRVAELDLEYTQVVAPVAGRVSRALVTPGNYVSGQAGSGTVLGSLVSVDPMHVYVDVDEASLLQLQRRLAAAELPLDEQGRVIVAVGLSEDEGYPLAGVVESLDNQVHPGTGSILMRVLVANPDGQLLPGLFARVQVPTSAPRATVLVPEQAIATDQSQKYVLVLAPGNVLERRAVELGSRLGDRRVVRAGLAAGDQVVVNGLAKVRAGQTVTPQFAEPQEPAAAAAQ